MPCKLNILLCIIYIGPSDTKYNCHTLNAGPTKKLLKSYQLINVKRNFKEPDNKT